MNDLRRDGVGGWMCAGGGGGVGITLRTDGRRR